MKEATRSALVELNRRFYGRFAESFSASRGRPWSGWDRLLDFLDGRDVYRVLDVGCGNGRFATYLAARLPRLAYLGIDGAPELLRLARQRFEEAPPADHSALAWKVVELTTGSLRQRLGEERFDLVALFGVLHHVPGRAHRRALLAELAARVAPGGLLATSVWRFDRLPRHASRVVAWEDYNRHAETPIDVADLETGDCLLSWAGQRAVPRYCHLVDDDEIDAWRDVSGLVEVARFTGQGGDASNLYVLYDALSDAAC